MSFEYDGTNDAHSIPDISSIGDYSFFCILHPVSNTDFDSPISADNFPTTPRDEFKYFPLNTNGAGGSLFEANVGGTGGFVSKVGALSTGVDHTIIFVRSSTTVRCYEDGTELGSGVTVGSGTFTAPNIRFGCSFYSGSNQNFCNARISEIGFWSLALSAGERASLDAFKSPLAVKPYGLIRYIPHVRQPTEVMTGATVTAIDAPTVVAHPRIYRPSAQIMQFTPSAAVASSVKHNLLLLGVGG